MQHSWVFLLIVNRIKLQQHASDMLLIQCLNTETQRADTIKSIRNINNIPYLLFATVNILRI